MRLDHIAYRVKNRLETAQFFIDAFGYRKQTEFSIDFEDGNAPVLCIALEPPEKLDLKDLPWIAHNVNYREEGGMTREFLQEYHLPPEIFISDGPPESIVGKWVARRDGVGGIHHLAYQVKSVDATRKWWQEKGWSQFTSDKPFSCDGLTQVFSKPHSLTGVIYEFIERQEFGFCVGNVKNLMQSTVTVDAKAA